jgi:hypothetical protein
MPDLYGGLSVLMRRRLMWIASGVSMLVLSVFNGMGAPLTTPAAPWGMISFQLARTPERVQAILASWDALTRQSAAFCLGLDYLFMLAYALAIGLAARWVGVALKQRGWPLAGSGVPLAWAVWLAALLDAIENAAQTAMLFGSSNAIVPGLTWLVALVKFSLVFAALVYVFYGLVACLGIKLPDSARQA